MYSFSAQASSVCKFGIFSSQETNIRDRVQVTPGLVGSSGQFELGVESVIKGDVVSNNVFLRDRSTVEKSVFASGSITKQNNVNIGGEEHSEVEINHDVIETKEVPVGSQNFNLYSGQSLVLEPGTYGNMHVHNNASLTLTAGVYNFKSFVMEAGEAQLFLNADAAFIEINTQDTLRFGDRNKFILSEHNDPVQVQFYTNSPNQVKIGTDSVFYGVVTAPNAEIYAFSRVTVNGALYGKKVIVDTDSTVRLYPNCTEYNTDFDESEQESMCASLWFEEDLWLPLWSAGGTTTSVISHESSANGSVLEVALNSDSYVYLQSQAEINMPFSEGASFLTAKVNLLSNAAPYSTWGGQIGVFIKTSSSDDFEEAGYAVYDPEDIYAYSMSTLEIPLPLDLSSQILNGGSFEVMLSLQSAQQEAVFWIDNLLFCDDNNMCNYSCPIRHEEGYTAPQEDNLQVKFTLENEDNYFLENQTQITGQIQNLRADNEQISLELVISPPQGESIIIQLDQVILAPEEIHTFDIPAQLVPETLPGVVNLMLIRARLVGERSNILGDSHTWFYKKTDTLDLYSELAFQEELNGTRYQTLPNEGSPYKIYDDEGNEAGSILLIQVDADLDTDGNPIIIL